MSITKEQQVRCQCGTVVRVVVADSLNAGRHPHLRQALLEGALHRFTCGACGASILVEKQLLYLDAERRHFFVVMPRAELAREREAIAITRQLFAVSFGPSTPAALQELGAAMMVRLCFGLPALREKVVADEAGLNDLALEALKCEVLATLPELAHNGAAALWLAGAIAAPGSGEEERAGAVDALAGDDLELMVETVEEESAGGALRSGEPVALRVPRATYESIAALGAEQILRFRPGLANGPHVSMQRLGLEPEQYAGSPARPTPR